MGNDWLTDDMMQRASKLIQDIDGIASQGTVYVVSRALYEGEKRGREEAANPQWTAMGIFKIIKDQKLRKHSDIAKAIAAAIRSGQ